MGHAGDYFATVSNSTGIAVTTPATLTPMSGDGGSFCGGRFKLDTTRFVDSLLPTVVITHGWQPGIGPYPSDGSPPGWVTAMASSITARLQREGSARGEDVRANILTYTWEEAFTDGPESNLAHATTCTARHGTRLGSQIRELLGADYSKAVQLIGHSLGSLVNAYAVKSFTAKLIHIPIIQFTILDPPLHPNPFTSESDYRKILAPLDVAWVDNYIGDIPTLFLGVPTFKIGDEIQGAAPNGGDRMQCAHTEQENAHGIYYCYSLTITDNNSKEGFYFSVLRGLSAGFKERPSPVFWTPPEPILRCGCMSPLLQKERRSLPIRSSKSPGRDFK
jgi:hypothetical protein